MVHRCRVMIESVRVGLATGPGDESERPGALVRGNGRRRSVDSTRRSQRLCRHVLPLDLATSSELQR